MTPIPPKLPIPPSLRGAEIGTWTHHSIAGRLPDILRRVLAENDFSAAIVQSLEMLSKEIPYGPIRLLRSTSAPDAAEWEQYTTPYLGQNWLEVPWFFVETYFYRRILEATGYFGPGDGQGVDPYAYQKHLGLESTRLGIQALSTQLNEALTQKKAARESFIRLLTIDLWGNKADLSLWPADEEMDSEGLTNVQQQQAHVLANDAPAVADHLASLGSQTTRVDFIVDNAGFELVCDLCLADFLLSSQMAQSVHLQLKLHPTFVSDATIKDVEHTMAFLANETDPDVRALAARLSHHLDQKRLFLRTDPYWTSSLSFWEVPNPLRQELAQSNLLISKGDANYRRLLGDRHWPFTTPFADIMNYTPAPLVALRTQKAEIAAGLQPGQAEAVAQQDPNWLINGQWGVIQFVKPA